MRIIIMGPPGSGKGTQAEILSEKLSIPHISTGAIIRNAIRNKTKFGIATEEYIEKGQLVPDELVIPMVAERVKEKDCENGYILDGFPRTLCQAQAMEENNIKVDCVLNLIVSDDEIVKRLGGRRECKQCAAPYHVEFNPPKNEGVCDKCGGNLIQRADDNEATIKERLSVYHKQTEPLVEFYKNVGNLVNVQGKDKIEDTTENVLKSLGVRS